MKQKLRFLNFLFCMGRLASLLRSGGIIIALLLCNAITIAQEQSAPDEFPVGTPIHHSLEDYPNLFYAFDTTGFNTIWQRADGNTHSLLENYELIAGNASSALEYINHYTTCYYSKWEAEQNKTDPERVGFKHYDYYNQGITFGDTATWKGKKCWSTKGLSEPACSLMYGPHYRQDNRYKRWLYGTDYQNVQYVPRFRMALDYNDTLVPQNEDVCVLKVVFRYKIVYSAAPGDYEFIDSVFMQRTLQVSDFDSTGEFDDFYLHENPELAWYKYPDEFILPKELENMANPPEYSYITYSESYTGIQFWVDWLRTDTLCNLYIDYAEVYDNDGWNEYLDPSTHDTVVQNIKTYAQSFPKSEWPNLIYWSGVDEPYSIDCYTPIRVVDELIRSVQAPPLIVHFDPSWWHTLDVNGEDEMEMFYNIAKPEKIILGMYPCSPDWPAIRKQDFDWLTFNFQRTSALDSSFWFKPQTFGFRTNYNYPNDPPEWCGWRKPDPPELTSMTMLALAHGAKGILFEWFDSFELTGYSSCAPAYIECLVDSNGSPEDNEGDILYYTVKDNLVPRLKDKLGKTLMNLDYTGNYINMEYHEQPNPESMQNDYLSIQHYGMSYFWHAGFFNHNNFPDKKYFLLTNLRVNYDIEAKLIVSNLMAYNNVSFVDVEGGQGRVDTTIGYNSSITYYETMPEGEGRLYRVAPVIKYGGRLLFDETISSTTTLIDEMTIEDDAVLTVNSTYNVDRTITIKDNGSINTTTGGTLKFYNNLSLVIEGSVTISGTSENKLILDFLSPADSNGIIIKPGGSLTISYCEIKNAGTGIISELNADSLSVQSVTFTDCENNSISIAGQSGEIIPLPTQIISCTIVNSNYGIWASNMSNILIQGNTITNTACGIFLSNVTDAQIIGNQINSNLEEYPGVWSFSSGGVTRGNNITGHTVGIHLANSSPKIGSNHILDNKYHGIYVGSGSVPYMRGEYIGDPPVMYALSGYNEIKENGGYAEIGGPIDNDGSEIYFYNSRALLDSGCNSIVDDRQVSRPLINTLLLMNGINSGMMIIIQAQNNFWGDTVYTARFGDLSVNYIPYESEPCPEPQGSGEEEFVMKNKFGKIIDTVYSAGVEVPSLSETELNYAIAEEQFLTGDLSSALQTYQGIINSAAAEEEKYLAYERKYSIGKLTGQSNEFFNELSNTFATLALNAEDSVSMKKLIQLSTLSKVGEQEYVNAINEFDGIIQQNPNTEEAVYAEIDALTTALLIEEADTTLQKGRLGKYLIKSSADYNQRVDEILRKHFGSNSIENDKEILPTEYTLYQNYPNPFNPTTTIKYDLPNASDISLIIYDIIGRKVKELVNTKQQAGRYEVQFNASNLASGVYIYQLSAEKYISSKKMILLK